jgi:hypothetical protein
LISRFSEYIDITVFRDDLGQQIGIEELEKLSGKQQRRHLEAIMQVCQSYIQGPLRKRLGKQMKAAMEQAELAGGARRRGLEFGSRPRRPSRPVVIGALSVRQRP